MAGLIFKALLQHLQAGEASASLQHRMFTNRFHLQKTRSLQCLMPSASALQFTASFTKCFANLTKQRSPWLCPPSCSWQCFYCDSPTEHCCEDLVHLEHSYYLLSFLFFWCIVCLMEGDISQIWNSAFWASTLTHSSLSAELQSLWFP